MSNWATMRKGRRKAANPPDEPGPLEIREGISGVYHYHLARAGEPLCGPLAGMTMPTKLPISGWGARGHLRESYCGECNRLRLEAAHA